MNEEEDKLKSASLEEVARAGILELLAVREIRKQRFFIRTKFTPDVEDVKNDWATESMSQDKIVERLMAPKIKTHLLSESAPRDKNILEDNKYYRFEMTAEIIKATIDILMKEKKIALAPPHDQEDSEETKQSGSSYCITDIGLETSGGAWKKLHDFLNVMKKTTDLGAGRN